MEHGTAEMDGKKIEVEVEGRADSPMTRKLARVVSAHASRTRRRRRRDMVEGEEKKKSKNWCRPAL